MKKVLLVVLLGLANLGFGLEYNGCFDDANLLKPETVASIQNIGKKLYDEGRVQFTVKVVEDCKDTLLDGREFFNTTGIGDKEKNNGLLLFVNAKNFRANKPNKIRLLTGYGLEGLFTDSLCGQILDQGLEQKGSDAKILEIVNLVNSEFQKLGDSPIPEKNQKLDKMLSVVGIVFIILFVIVVIVFVLSEGDGTSSGGCGSGYDGGGGFSGGGFGGGFGGGSCGGGGAGR